MPTLTESDIDLVFTNWRGVLAPPGISEERRDELIGYLEEMHDSPEWQQALEDNGWIDTFRTGDEFDVFLEEQDARVASTLEGAGTPMSTSTTDHGRASEDAKPRDLPQLGLAALLAVIGGYTLYDATTLEVGFADPVGPRLFPYVVGTVLVGLAVLLAVATLRGDRPEEEGGEDVDLTQPGRLGDRPQAGRRSWCSRSPRSTCSAGRSPGRCSSRAPPGRSAAAPCQGRPHRGRPLGGQLVRLLRRSRHPAERRPPGRGALMESLDLLWGGLEAALTPTNLMYAAIGVLLGTFVGVLPGIGPAMAVALLLPVTFGLEPTQAFIMFAGIYYGGMYGGSTTSILLNTPGESASVMTAIEGNKMAKRGRAAQALATAAIGSFIAGTIGTLLVVFFAPALADVAVEIGAPSYLAITLMAMVLVTSVLGSSRLRGFIALFLGLTIGLVGLDLNTGQARLSFDQPQLADRLDIVVVAVGIFALGEALWVAAHLRRRPLEIIPVGQPFMGREDWGRSWKPWLRGTALGFPFGAVPAGGAETPTFLSYVLERRLARKHRDEFGKGAIEGVAGPEAANNASAAGTFVPLLALGLPGHRDGDDHARRLPELRHPAGTRS